MIQNIYTVYDNAAKAFLPPFYVQNDEVAIRTFADAVYSDNHQFNRYPADYTLMYAGTFEDSTGIFKTKAPTKVVGALEVPRPKQLDQLDLMQEFIGDAPEKENQSEV